MNKVGVLHLISAYSLDDDYHINEAWVQVSVSLEGVWI